MARRICRAVLTALALTALGSQAVAHGWGHHHRGWHHRGYSSGVWLGLGALLGSGLTLAVGSGSRHGYGGAIAYTSPPFYYGRPSYAAPPVYAQPAPVYQDPPVYGYGPDTATQAPAPMAYAGVAGGSSSRFDVAARPAQGQDEEQQARDRQECSRWAMNQSGFDPANVTRWTTSVATESYRRALGGCLQDRGYSVD